MFSLDKLVFYDAMHLVLRIIHICIELMKLCPSEYHQSAQIVFDGFDVFYESIEVSVFYSKFTISSMKFSDTFRLGGTLWRSGIWYINEY